MTQVLLYRRDFSAVLDVSDLILDPVSYSWKALGGPERARIEVEGAADRLWETLNWLRCPVVIYNDLYQAMWWGFVERAVIATGAVEIGISLDNMANRIAVVYSGRELPGSPVEEGTTDWAENADSIAEYGYKETLHTLSDATEERAEDARDTALAQLRYPVPTVRLGGAGRLGVTLECRGWWDTLGWRYYSQAAGQEQYTTTGSAKFKLGLGYTSDEIGFHQGRWVADLDGKWTHFEYGDEVVISGSTDNDGTVILHENENDDAWVYVSDRVEFSRADYGQYFVYDDYCGFKDELKPRMLIKATGTDGGEADGFYWLQAVTDNGNKLTLEDIFDHWGVYDGDDVTFYRGGRVKISTVTTVVHELPTTTVSVVLLHTKVAQSFTLSVNMGWTVGQVQLYMKKVGAPTDNVVVKICANSSGSPGTVMETLTLGGASIGTEETWYEFAAAHTTALAYGVTYWVTVERSGGHDPDNYYEINLNEALGYTGGSLKVWDGSTWEARSPDADMPFRVLGEWTIGTHVGEMIDASGQFIAGVDVLAGNDTYAPMYRAGQATALVEIEKLLAAGTTAGARLLGTVTIDRDLQVDVEADSDGAYLLASDGRLLDQYGQALPQGSCPAGVWVTLRDAVPATMTLSALASASPIFIERAEYQVDTGALTLEPRGVPSPWDLGKVDEG